MPEAHYEIGVEQRSRELVKRLSKEGFQSPYLERLQERYARRGRTADAIKQLELEMLQEMAASLGRTEEKLNVALLELDLIEKKLEALTPGDPGRARCVAAFNAQREEAQRRRLNLQIQRETLGFGRNDKLLKEHYPLPPARRS